jgi:proteasome accessory factor C
VNAQSERLSRLLALVPWLLAHPDTPAAEVADEFGVTEAQLRTDLDLLWMCGLPGHGPGDLIDVVWRRDRVTLVNADTIAAPLRLQPTEAVALVAALRALSDTEGLVGADAVDRALAKLEAAAGGAAAGDRVVAVRGPVDDAADDPRRRQVTTAVTEALARGTQLHLRYWVPARDEVTERDVDPIRVFTGDGASYLSAYCRSVDDIRTFRLDRVIEAVVLDSPLSVPDSAAASGRLSTPDATFVPDPQDRLVRFELSPAARWVADYYPCEEVVRHDDGSRTVALRARDDDWVRRLALTLAGSARLLDPPELVEQVRAAAQAALDGYDETAAAAAAAGG